MKVVGIVAEYNPFHNGHNYQIAKIREETKADYIIIAMSGNFLQRGVPALCNKFTRTEMALRCGADLVLEIPTVWATASAEYYAQAGVSLLVSTGVVTHLCFGAETDDIDSLVQISSILKEEPEIYRIHLTEALRNGVSFPVARKYALSHTLPQFSTEKWNEILDNPNNILALEYLKALPASIAPILIKREGAGYHDTDICTIFPSASAIRKAIFEPSKDFMAISNSMPIASFTLLKGAYETSQLLTVNDFSPSLGYCLLAKEDYDFTVYADCSLDLSNKIKKNVRNYVFLEDFIERLKTKDMTYTRISRCLLHILLDIRQSDYALGQTIGFAPYLRILGFRKDASALLSMLKHSALSPIISKAADADSLLDDNAYHFFEKDVFASNLYYQHEARKSGMLAKNEYTNQIILI